MRGRILRVWVIDDKKLVERQEKGARGFRQRLIGSCISLLDNSKRGAKRDYGNESRQDGGVKRTTKGQNCFRSVNRPGGQVGARKKGWIALITEKPARKTDRKNWLRWDLELSKSGKKKKKKTGGHHLRHFDGLNKALSEKRIMDRPEDRDLKNAIGTAYRRLMAQR